MKTVLKILGKRIKKLQRKTERLRSDRDYWANECKKLQASLEAKK